MSDLTKEQQDEKDRIRLLQYDNLRKHFTEDLIEPVLGKGYWNMGQCVYSCDILAVEDLRSKFEEKDRKINFYEKFTNVLAVALLIMSMMFLISLGWGF